MSISVVIPFHNQVHWLGMCLGALASFDDDLVSEIVVVNDGSSDTDQSVAVEFVARNPKARMINNTEGRGFGAACNYGARNSSGSALLFLNTDCLVARNTMAQLWNCLEDPKVGLVSTLTNSAAETAYPMYHGLTYLDMASLLEKLPGPAFLDCRTAEGHCLLVRRELFLQLNGFSPDWGLGYGEETDLHFKVLDSQFRSVVSLTTYVYHQGSQSFNEIEGAATLKRNNSSLFYKKWGTHYKNAAHLARSGPLEVHSRVSSTLGNLQHVDYDVLFVLPGIGAAIGGIQSILDAANSLILDGYSVGCVLMSDGGVPRDDPMLFRPLVAKHPKDIEKIVSARIIISTHHVTIPFANALSSKISSVHYNYAQGLETLFSDGLEAFEAADSISTVQRFFVNSSWTMRMLQRFSPEAEFHLAYPNFIPGLFRDRNAQRVYDALLLLRSAPAKGQYRLMDFLFRMSRFDIPLSFAVIASGPYFTGFSKMAQVPGETGAGDRLTCQIGSLRVTVLKGPVSRSALAEILSRSRIYVDASDHEGLGLVAMQASLSGAVPICTDFGGFTVDFPWAAQIVPTSSDIQENLCSLVIETLGRAEANGPIREVGPSLSQAITSKLGMPLNGGASPAFGSPSLAARPLVLSYPSVGESRKVRLARAIWKRTPGPLRIFAVRSAKAILRVSSS